MIDFVKISKIFYLLGNPQLIPSMLNGMVLDTYQNLNHQWFYALNIDTVIDIGANVGKTVLAFNVLLPEATIYAFEPLPECYEQLCKRTAKIAKCKNYNLALGAENGILQMNQSNHRPSSSLLKMSSLHSEAFSFTSDSTEVSINVVPLDSLSLEVGRSILIKVDVQGYESIVIDGGRNIFSAAKIVIMEVSYEELYEKQVLFDGIYSMMKGLGFTFAGTTANLKDPRTGKIIEADAIFLKC
jgi:FkbM family methyltransferase